MADAPLDQLAKAIVTDRAVLVLGTGVTAHATGGDPLATWLGLLKHGIAYCAKVGAAPQLQCDRYLADLADPGGMDEYLAAATFIETKLGKPTGHFVEWLDETVGQLTASDERLIRTLDALATPLITTNYDDLVATRTGRRTSTWLDGAGVGRLLRGDGVRFVHHLHGVWDKPESIILGTRSYTDITQHIQIQDSLKAIILTRPLIFVGCGGTLDDPNLGALIEWLRAQHAETSGRHYRLALKSEASALRVRHKGEPIDIVEYGAAHADLVSFVERLAISVTTARGTPSSGSRTSSLAPAPSAPAWFLPPDPLCLGRDEEVKRAVRYLCDPKPRPVPILGGPGIGKSTISVSALHTPDVVDRFGDRRAFVRCDGLTEPAALLGRIAEAIRTTPGANLDDRVLTDLRCAPAAIALDNFETPWEADALAAEEILARLAAVPGLVLLVSIRSEEKPLQVDWTEPIDVRRLAKDIARSLFLRIAGQKLGNDPDLERVLAIAEGVPLALILLAHRADGESNLAGLWHTWQEQRTRLLSRSDVGSPTRLTNLAVSLELSITASPRMQAEPNAHRLLSVLAHLPAGVAHADLESVSPDSSHASASLLRKVGLAVDENNRTRLLAPIAEYVKLVHPPNDDDLKRVMGFYADLIATEGAKVGAEGGAEAVLRLEPEIPNLGSAIESVSIEDVPRAAAACYGLAEFHRFTGLGSASVIQGVAAHAAATHDIESQARCIGCLGDIALDRSDHEGARARYEEALPLYRRAGSVLGEANCIQALGDIALRRSDHEAARARYEEALPLFRRVGSVLGEANCIKSLGDITLDRSDHEAARRRYEEALPLFRRVGDVLGEANCIKSLGNIALDRSDHEAARARYEEALPLYRRVGDVLGEANCIKSFGDIAARENHIGEARERWGAALSLYTRISEPDSIGSAHRRLARHSTGPERTAHLAAAHDAWRSINRPDLIEELREEFLGECPDDGPTPA